jgi:hypothetical protein
MPEFSPPSSSSGVSGSVPSVAVSLTLDSLELASTYDRVSKRQCKHRRLSSAALAAKTGERVLDIGRGTGRLGACATDRVAPDGEVIGVQPLPLRVAIAAEIHSRFSAGGGRAEDLSRFPSEGCAGGLTQRFEQGSDQGRLSQRPS